MPTVKYCPFCGSPYGLLRIGPTWEKEPPKTVYKVECGNCGRRYTITWGMDVHGPTDKMIRYGPW